MIHVDSTRVLEVLGEHGEYWDRGGYDLPDNHHCLHGAIRMCQEQPGDASLVEQVAAKMGWGTGWNDRQEDFTPILARIEQGLDVTDEMLAETYGPQWEQIVALVRRAASLTANERKAYAANVAYAANAANVAYAANAANVAYAANAANVANAAQGLAIRHLIGQYSYTQDHYDTLTGPWRRIIGPVHPDDKELS